MELKSFILRLVTNIVIFLTELRCRHNSYSNKPILLLKSSLQTLYGRHHEQVYRDKISISQMAMDIFSSTQICSCLSCRQDFYVEFFLSLLPTILLRRFVLVSLADKTFTQIFSCLSCRQDFYVDLFLSLLPTRLLRRFVLVSLADKTFTQIFSCLSSRQDFNRG